MSSFSEIPVLDAEGQNRFPVPHEGRKFGPQRLGRYALIVAVNLAVLPVAYAAGSKMIDDTPRAAVAQAEQRKPEDRLSAGLDTQSASQAEQPHTATAAYGAANHDLQSHDDAVESLNALLAGIQPVNDSRQSVATLNIQKIPN